MSAAALFAMPSLATPEVATQLTPRLGESPLPRKIIHEKLKNITKYWPFICYIIYLPTIIFNKYLDLYTLQFKKI